MTCFKKAILAVGVIGFMVLGCSLQQEIFPTHDEVLLVNLPFDITYLRSLEALETFQDWELEETEKEKGTINVRNIAYGKFGDADKRLITVEIRRVNRKQTSVQIAQEHQQVLGGGLLLERISEFLSREMSFREEK